MECELNVFGTFDAKVSCGKWVLADFWWLGL